MDPHQWLQDWGAGAYRWLRRRGNFSGHSRHIGWLATWACRAAQPFFSDVLFRVPTAERTLYLTFDDGPTHPATERVLELLERYEALATFFLLGRQVEADPGLVRETFSQGHALGNHTWSHCDLWQVLFPEAQAELERTEDVIAELTGCPPHFVRPPKGHLTAKLRNWCRSRGRRLTMWDAIAPDFLPTASPQAIASFLERYARPGGILVLHDNADTQDRTPAALELLLPRLRDAGWTFARLPEQET